MQDRILALSGKRSWQNFPIIEGTTQLTAIAFPHSFLTSSQYSAKRQRHLIQHLDDQLCVWKPSQADLVFVRQRGFKITCITGWRGYLGGAQHNYAHWTRVELPEGHHDIASLEHIPGVLPFEVYAQAPLRLISWCSFELDSNSRTLLGDLMCENPDTSMNQLVSRIARIHPSARTEQDAIHYLGTLATVRIAAKAQVPNYTTMVQHFLRTLQLPIAIYMLDYYLPMLNPNDGYN